MIKVMEEFNLGGLFSMENLISALIRGLERNPLVFSTRPMVKAVLSLILKQPDHIDL